MSVRIGKPAPNFKKEAVVNGEFKDVSLSDYKGKYVILFFYPLDFTFVCPTEIVAFSERTEEFRKLGVEILGASVDSVYAHLAWINTSRKAGGLGSINFPLISDQDHSLSTAYGVLQDDGFTIRGSFLIDPKGIVRQITLNDRPVGRSVDEALRLVQGFLFADEHGEVCPANWAPGKPTMHADPTKSKEYFEKHA